MNGVEVQNDPDYMPRDESLNLWWCQMFGHPYTQCKFLSGIEGDLGNIHKGHIDIFNKVMTQFDPFDPT